MNALLCPSSLLRTAAYPLSRLALRSSVQSVLDTISFVRPFSYDHVVIGAGVVGLAVAAKLAKCIGSQAPSLLLDVPNRLIY
jgi:hypothetical protein